MKTYREVKNAPIFDWNKFFNKDSYSYEELGKAKEFSANWTTCATGNQCSIIPRDQSGCPNDFCLAIAGISFDVKIGMMLYYFGNKQMDYFEAAKAKAIETLSNIERISSKLIEEEMAKTLIEMKKLSENFEFEKRVEKLVEFELEKFRDNIQKVEIKTEEVVEKYKVNEIISALSP